MYTYQHGGFFSRNQTKKYYDFSANINPLGMPQKVKAALQAAIKVSDIYPDPFCSQLSKALARKLKVKSSAILCGNGAADLLFKLAVAIKPRQTLLLAPTFSDYEKAFLTSGSKFTYYALQESNNFQVGSDILTLLKKPLELIVICNPNNPTGQVIPKALLREIIEKAQKEQIRVLVDECFMNFVSQGRYSMQSYLTAYPNLVILQAFTKMYAMAGVRLGYLLSSDAELLLRLRECSQDWSVSTLAQYAGRGALQCTGFVEATRKYVAGERIYLYSELSKFAQLTVFPGQANYLLIKANPELHLSQSLAAEGIIIRNCSNYHNLAPGFLRLAVRTHKENTTLIKALKRILL